jgi:nucleoside-diphosphate-sugar epimerase
MMLTGRWKPRAFVHSTASATRIARFPIDFVMGDLCDPESVDRAMRGCSAVVHLARGHIRLMRRGLENVLQAASRNHCSRVIHISSVAVYGDNPPPESVTEAAPPRKPDNAYGKVKLWQEQRLLSFGKSHGLPYIILRPPNVYGAFSHFTQTLITRIQAGTLAVLDRGNNPCNLVYIDNLVEAILLSLWKDAALGEIFFVTDREVISWGQCLADHAAWFSTTLPLLARHELVSRPRKRLVFDSLKLLPRTLLSGEVRRLLRAIPVIDRLEGALGKGLESLSAESQQKLRIALNGPLSFSRNGVSSAVFYNDDPIMISQGRSVAHSGEKAQRLLGYSAPVSYTEGMALTKAWVDAAHILGAGYS